MAVFGNSNAKGNRESLADIIKDISPEDTPALSNFGSGKAYATTEEWQTDALSPADPTNSVIEGTDTTLATVNPTTRLANYIQDFEIGFAVSNVQDKVRKAGRKSEVSYQVEKAFRQLKVHVEAMLTQNNVAIARVSGTTASRSAGLETFAWAVNNVANATTGGHGASGTTQVIATGAPITAITDGTGRAFSDTQLKTSLAAGFSLGARYKMAIMPFAQKQVMAGFTGVASTRMTVDLGKKEMAGIIGAVDVYVSDGGAIMLTPSANMRNTTAKMSVLLVDPECVDVLFLQEYEHEELAKTGAYTKHRVGCNATLRVKNPRGVAKIADLN